MPVTRSQKSISLYERKASRQVEPSQRSEGDRAVRKRSADETASSDTDDEVSEGRMKRSQRSKTIAVAHPSTTRSAAATEADNPSQPSARMTRSQHRASMQRLADETVSTLSNLSTQQTEVSTSGMKRLTRSSVASLPGKMEVSKKARFSKDGPSAQLPAKRNYNLRSQQSHTSPPDDVVNEDSKPPAVTPGTVTRQINFDRTPPPADNGLPEGVVNIFAKPSKVRSKSLCSCPSTNMGETIQILSSHHLTEYGAEYCEQLKKREQRDLDQLSANLKSVRTDDDDDDDDDDGLDIFNRSGGRQENDSSDEEDNEPSATMEAQRSLDMKSSRRSSSSSSSETTVGSDWSLNISDMEPLPRQPFLTAKMRRVLVNWLSEVSVEYKLSEATLHLAVTLLDVLLTLGPTRAQLLKAQELVSDDEDEEESCFTIRRTDFQAVGCACIWIASKMEDRSPPRVEDLVYISDYSFSTEKLRRLESRICNVLKFRLHRATPFHFLQINLRASHACPLANCHLYLNNSVLLNLNLYLLELSRSSYVLSSVKPSLLSAACMYLARATLGLRAKQQQAVDEHGVWTKTLEFYTGYSVKALTNTVLQIHRLQLGAEKSDNGVTPAFNKYKKAEKFFVSLKTVLRVEDLGLATDMKHNDLAVVTEDHSVLL